MKHLTDFQAYLIQDLFSFTAAVTRIDYFDDHQVFNNLQAKEMYHFKVDSHHLMAISIQTAIGDPCTISKIYMWNYRTERFSEYQNLSLIGARKFLSFKEGRDNFLFVATMGKSCAAAGKHKPNQ